jgi:hypothetical protein
MVTFVWAPARGFLPWPTTPRAKPRVMTAVATRKTTRHSASWIAPGLAHHPTQNDANADELHVPRESPEGRSFSLGRADPQLE